MTTINEHGEFTDRTPPETVRIRTDEEKRQAALKKLVDMGIVRICDVCGKPFKTTDPYKRNAKRCSWKCTQEANRRRARERNRRLRESKRKRVDE